MTMQILECGVPPPLERALYIFKKLSWKILIIVDNLYIKGFSFIVCLKVVTLILITTFRPHTAGLHQVIVSIYWVELFVPLWLLVIGVSQTSLMVGGFRSKALLALWEEETDPSAVCSVRDRLSCYLIVGIHVSEISIPLFLLMLLGWSLMWIASLTVREYQWRSRSLSINFSGPLRDQFLPLTMPTILWIETHQPWERFVIHQSLTTTVVQIVRLSKLSLSPEEDLQCAVETSRSISKWQQSCDKR